jgi:hypothetical protein
MSQETIEIVRRCYEADERRDVSAMLEDAGPDLVNYRPELVAATYHWPEGYA